MQKKSGDDLGKNDKFNCVNRLQYTHEMRGCIKYIGYYKKCKHYYKNQINKI